jgi:flavin-dependent dehydrogenase
VSSLKHITIIGGGLAGLTLGIGLRHRGIPVTILEAGQYPRHRVCGEFISGQGQAVLGRLGLADLFAHAGARLSRTATFFLGATCSPVHSLNPPALCLSRLTMDEMLAVHFRKQGGQLREQSRWAGKRATEGVVITNGRRIQNRDSGWRWCGLKIHAREVELGSDLEMHSSTQGYVGLCRLPEEKVNVCGLFRTRPGTPFKGPRELLKGLPGTVLRQRLANATFDEGSFCSVGGLPLRPQRARQQTELRLGDALTMIPPITGNGMSMAFEAAELALDPICAYARGDLSWKAAREGTAQACDDAFKQRLFWAQWLHAAMFAPSLRNRLGEMLLNCDWLWNQLITRTR